jgi:hypothetical protein
MLLMLFHVLRLATGGGWAGLTLYLPLLWLSFTPILSANDGPYEARWNTFTHFAVGPFRYFGPCLTLGFLAAYLLRPSRGRLLLLFFVAGAAAVNNLDFGLPALGAALVAALCTTGDGPLPRWRTILRTLAGGVLGAGAAVAAFLLLTRLRSGRLPEWRMVTSYQRAFAVNGFGMLPMPTFGLHWVIYLTFMAAIARGLFDGSASRLRRGLCLYSGVFGTGALMYYVGRSHPQVLVMVFPAWALSFVLLAWLGLEDVRARLRARGFLRALTPGAVLLGAGYVSVLATFAERPNVVQQVRRLTAPCGEGQPGNPLLGDTAALADCVRAHAAPGEKVGIIAPYGHLVAGETGVVNVFPFSCPGSLIVRSQLSRATQALQASHVLRVFAAGVSPDVALELCRLGFRQEDAGNPILWTRRDLADPPSFWWQWSSAAPDRLQETGRWCGSRESLVVYNPGPDARRLTLRMRCTTGQAGRAVLRFEGGEREGEQSLEDGGGEAVYEFTAPAGILVLRLSCGGKPAEAQGAPSGAVYRVTNARLSEVGH